MIKFLRRWFKKEREEKEIHGYYYNFDTDRIDEFFVAPDGSYRPTGTSYTIEEFAADKIDLLFEALDRDDGWGKFTPGAAVPSEDFVRAYFTEHKFVIEGLK